MTDPRDHLFAPLGRPGSGRERYGAAMALWQDGVIGPDVLEVFRIAAAHDGLDARELLADRGLPVPPVLRRR